jgi:hypothetical protein
MKLEPIRLRLIPREPVRDENPREAFWRAVRQDDNRDASITEAEGKLRREFGPALRQLLVQEISEPLRQLDENLYRGEFRNLEHFFFRFFDRPDSDKYWDRGQALDALARLMEQRQAVVRDNPALRRIQERLAAASSITFSVRIAGYSSLSLDLSVGSLKAVADAFDHDFESFRVFLEAFVPQAYGRVFWEAEANRLDFDIQVPASYEQALVSPPSSPPLADVPPSVAALPPVASQPPAPSARDKAEWLWRLANGSLLVPLLLALAVMYYGLSLLRDFKNIQGDALKPILDHQLKLLEEDRRRMFREVPSPATSASSASAAAK